MDLQLQPPSRVRAWVGRGMMWRRSYTNNSIRLPTSVNGWTITSEAFVALHAYRKATASLQHVRTSSFASGERCNRTRLLADLGVCSDLEAPIVNLFPLSYLIRAGFMVVCHEDPLRKLLRWGRRSHNEISILQKTCFESGCVHRSIRLIKSNLQILIPTRGLSFTTSPL